MPPGQGALKGWPSFLSGSGSRSPFTWSHPICIPAFAPELPAFSLRPHQLPSFLNQSKPDHTQLFVPRHGWGMNGRFVPGCTKPFVLGQPPGVGAGGLGSRQGKQNPILPGWLTDFNYTWPGGRAQAGTRGPRGCSRGKEVIAGGPIPGGFTVKCMCQPPPDSLFPPHPSSAPHPAVWDEKTPLYGVFATTMKAFFFSFLRIHPCIPKGAFITPCPGCRHLPASDPPVQKGGLVRHMKPAPLDIWTKRS